MCWAIDGAERPQFGAPVGHRRQCQPTIIPRVFLRWWTQHVDSVGQLGLRSVLRRCGRLRGVFLWGGGGRIMVSVVYVVR